MTRFDAAVGRRRGRPRATPRWWSIDDGSTDATAETARRLLAHLPHHRVISLPVNRGKGAAVRTGVAQARTPYVAYMDADMAIDPRAVPCCSTPWRTSDVAIGSRALADSMVESTYAVRAVMGRLFNRLVTTGTGLGPAGHPVRVQGLPDPGRPAPLPPGAASTGSPSTSRSCPGPAASASGSPRSRCSGSTFPGAPSTRSTTRSPCSPTSTARASACWPPRRCPPSWCGAGPVQPAHRRRRRLGPIGWPRWSADTLDGAPVPVVADRPVGGHPAAPGGAGRRGCGLLGACGPSSTPSRSRRRFPCRSGPSAADALPGVAWTGPHRRPGVPDRRTRRIGPTPIRAVPWPR